jgi:EAL domain-containing protein (putative c-di-GMP-specific phosphodiesterase class I)
MAHLKNLPVHELKVDRSFVSQMTSNTSDAVIVRSTADLGRNLGLRVVAEGVEDPRTVRELDALGCDAVQGYPRQPACCRRRADRLAPAAAGGHANAAAPQLMAVGITSAPQA